MQEDDHAFVARFGNTIIRGSSFEAVGDALEERGFRMIDAVHVGPGEIEIPHSKPRRQSARLKAKPPEPEPPPVIDRQITVELARVEFKTAEIMSGAAPAVGDFGTRACGAVHSDGVVCLIAVFVEKVQDCPACSGEIIYHHEGPHECADEDGVKYRWFAVTVIQDCEFNAYGPMEEDEDDE